MNGGQRIHLIASRLHKRLALLIGSQMLIRFASEALTSFLPKSRPPRVLSAP